MTKRILISGAPGSGKTSIINELSNIGYRCHKEISREIIAHQIAVRGKITPWEDLQGFSKIVLEKRIAQFNDTINDIEFYDRGIIDIIAYMRKDDLKIKPDWIRIAKEYRYFNKVFITPPWKEIYHKDDQRMEDFNTSIRVHEFMVSTYKSFGYEVLLMPKVNISKRINFIQRELERE